MKCTYCGKGFDNGVKVMYPIDKAGTKGRRWACLGCLMEKKAKKYGITVKKLERNMKRKRAIRNVKKKREIRKK